MSGVSGASLKVNIVDNYSIDGGWSWEGKTKDM